MDHVLRVIAQNKILNVIFVNNRFWMLYGEQLKDTDRMNRQECLIEK